MSKIEDIKPVSFIDLSKFEILEWINKLDDICVGFFEEEVYYFIPKQDLVLVEYSSRGFPSKFKKLNLKEAKERILEYFPD